YLQNYFGTTVNIKRQKKKGKIEIEFFSNEDLDRILELLSERES
ncbi:chromosome partitioning protein ParB, partial [Bacillus subtilis]